MFAMYNHVMEVSVSELRQRLKSYIQAAQAGTRILITDRGQPAARLVGVDGRDSLERWRAEGLVVRSRAPRKSRMTGAKRLAARGSVADLVERR